MSNQRSSAQGGPNIVTDRLVLYLDAANRNSYISGSNNWNDLTTYGNNGALINGPVFDSANVGSIIFDGVNEYLNINNNDYLNPGTGSFTIISWVNTNPWVGDGWDLWVSKRGNFAEGYYLGCQRINPTSARARFMVYSNFGRTDTPFISYTSDTWAMFTGILNRESNIQTIIRNDYQETASTTPAGGDYYTTNPLTIGGDLGTNLYYVQGKQSVVMIYKKALTQEEVVQNYNVLKYRYNL